MSEIEDEMQRWASKIQRRVKESERLCFPTRLKIITPTHRKDGTSCKDSIRALRRSLNKITQGSTISPNLIGTGFDDEGNLTTENVDLIMAAHCLKGEEADEIGKAITQYAIECEQQSISVTDSEFHILPTKALEGWFLEELQKPEETKEKRRPAPW